MPSVLSYALGLTIGKPTYRRLRRTMLTLRVALPRALSELGWLGGAAAPPSEGVEGEAKRPPRPTWTRWWSSTPTSGLDACPQPRDAGTTQLIERPARLAREGGEGEPK